VAPGFFLCYCAIGQQSRRKAHLIPRTQECTMSLLQVERDNLRNILSIVMPRPSNFHAHLRLDALMRAIAKDIMRWVKYLLVMPNNGPIDTVEKVIEYYNVLMDLAARFGCQPTLIMTVYLTDKLTPAMVEMLARLPFKVAVKYYPPHKGATTNSGLGVPLSEVKESLKAMAAYKIRLLGHFESVYDGQGRELPMELREGYFMQHEFPRLREENPDLHINIEHASTRIAIEHVKADKSGKTTCGQTPQHMLLTLSQLKKKSWANHGRCMPILKEQDDVDACFEFGTSGDPRTHLGDDTAGHLSKTKMGLFDEANCGCFLPHSLAVYAFIFEKAKALDDRFVAFACNNGPDMWGLPRPAHNDTVKLVSDFVCDIPEPTPVPEEDDVVIPLGWTRADDKLSIGLRLVA
jgi:dihydroorotase